jgi:hypothetical protein
VPFCIVVFSYSISDLMGHAGIDLRNRVVGARALLSFLDPYSIDWRPGIPLELADTWQRYPGVTRVTATPSLLLLYIPFAQLPYRTQHLIWWALQWLALAAAIAALARSFSDGFERNVFILIAIVCFAGSWFWRLHVERGQYYIFFVLLVCLDLAALRDHHRRPGWLGIPSGIAVALKPTALLLLPALWVMGERRAALAGCFAAAAVFAVSLYPSGPKVWSSFLSVVDHYAQLEIDPAFESSHFGPVTAVAPDIIEGMNFAKGKELGVGRSWGHRIVPSTLTSFFRARWAIYLNEVAMVSLTVFGPIAVWWLKWRCKVDRERVLLLVALLLAIVDFARPTRWNYVDVVFLPVTAFLVSLLPRSPGFVALACLTYVCYLAPLETEWFILARYFLTVLLAGATLAVRPGARGHAPAIGDLRSTSG